MTKYSDQAKDKIYNLISNPNVTLVEASVENALIDILLNGKPLPREWKKASFSPANQYKDAIELLGFFHGVDEWNIAFHKDTQMFEVFVVDKKYSVAAARLSRAVVLALWNYHQLKDKS